MFAAAALKSPLRLTRAGLAVAIGMVVALAAACSRTTEPTSRVTKYELVLHQDSFVRYNFELPGGCGDGTSVPCMVTGAAPGTYAIDVFVREDSGTSWIVFPDSAATSPTLRGDAVFFDRRTLQYYDPLNGCMQISLFLERSGGKIDGDFHREQSCHSNEYYGTVTSR